MDVMLAARQKFPVLHAYDAASAVLGEEQWGGNDDRITGMALGLMRMEAALLIIHTALMVDIMREILIRILDRRGVTVAQDRKSVV